MKRNRNRLMNSAASWKVKMVRKHRLHRLKTLLPKEKKAKNRNPSPTAAKMTS